jgi:hypothetical protein
VPERVVTFTVELPIFSVAERRRVQPVRSRKAIPAGDPYHAVSPK